MTEANKTALIVDDSKSARLVLKRVLETHEINVDSAESAEAALDYLVGNRPDVIFMDHLMPGMDGFEAVSAIKQNPETATIPIMMYTSQKGEVYVGQARALGAVGVLPKEIAPVQVSKVLKSLHLIGDKKQPPPESQQPPGGETAPPASLDQDLRILIQDLFKQQQEIMRRDLHDSFDTVVTRIGETLQPAQPEVGDELPIPEAKTSSGLLRGSVVVLTIFTMVFAWLYLQRENSLQDMRTQNIELQQALETQRLAAAEELRQALDTRGTMTLEDTATQQQIADYRQTLSALNAVTIESLEWGANLASRYDFGVLPLDDERLKIVERLTDYLLATEFSGAVRIETHVANYCLTVTGSGGYVPAVDRTATDCDRIGLSSAEAYETGLGQSVAFANFVRLAEEQANGRIRFEIVSRGNSNPLLEYPATADGVSARTWNRIAAANNRVIISVLSDSR